ncbi:nickel ABC transporter substrate-binding protein [Malaciobacter mytili]|uniref:nickel ABC transporter substrate-binding protein n=1 Tax=Malaciobacter mytili TaxID=603050 RepID=UPI003A8B8857
MLLKNKWIASSLLAISLMLGSTTTATGNDVTLKNQLTYVNYRDIRDLNPHLYSGELFAQNLLFESLVKIENDGSYTPWLAKSWEIKDKGKTYVFQLRDDVYFHDGEKFNAKAAKANFDAILDNSKRHSWESIPLMLEVEKSGKKAIEVTGEYELTLHLASAYYPLLTELGVTRPFRFISPKSFKDGITKNGVTKMSGTGPYILKSNKIDEYSVFVTNDKYWGKKPKIEKIVAKVIPDEQTRLLALENGEIDLIFGPNMISAEAYNIYSNKSGFKGIMSEPVSTRMLLLNTTNHILKDVRVRQALSYATDKVKISKGLFDGIESPADTLMSKNTPYSDIGLKPYEFSFEKAKKLLDEAGWEKVDGKKYRQKDGKDLEIILNYDANKVTDNNIAEFLQSQYAKIGIHLNIKGEEEQAFRDRQKAGNFAITFNIGWGIPYDPQSFLGGMTKPVYGDYMAQQGLSNKKELDEHILAAFKSVDEGERQKHYKYVLETLHNQAVYLPLTYKRNRAIFNEKVKGVSFNISQFEVPMEKMNIE